MIKISMPLSVPISSKKKFILNLNNYRNAHYQVLNKSKIEYATIAKAKLKELNVPNYEKVLFIYTLYPGTNRLMDVGNITCIHEKYFNDAFVSYGCIGDDNYTFVPMSFHFFGSVDKDNPRVEISIISLKEDNMKFEVDVKQLVLDHVQSLVTINEDTDINIDQVDGKFTVELIKKSVSKPVTKPKPTPAPKVVAEVVEEAMPELEAEPMEEVGKEPTKSAFAVPPQQTEQPIEEKKTTKKVLFGNLAGK